MEDVVRNTLGSMYAGKGISLVLIFEEMLTNLPIGGADTVSSLLHMLHLYHLLISIIIDGLRLMHIFPCYGLIS